MNYTDLHPAAQCVIPICAASVIWAFFWWLSKMP